MSEDTKIEVQVSKPKTKKDVACYSCGGPHYKSQCSQTSQRSQKGGKYGPSGAGRKFDFREERKEGGTKKKLVKTEKKVESLKREVMKVHKLVARPDWQRGYKNVDATMARQLEHATRSLINTFVVDAPLYRTVTSAVKTALGCGTTLWTFTVPPGTYLSWAILPGIMNASYSAAFSYGVGATTFQNPFVTGANITNVTFPSPFASLSGMDPGQNHMLRAIFDIEVSSSVIASSGTMRAGFAQDYQGNSLTQADLNNCTAFTDASLSTRVENATWNWNEKPKIIAVPATTSETGVPQGSSSVTKTWGLYYGYVYGGAVGLSITWQGQWGNEFVAEPSAQPITDNQYSNFDAGSDYYLQEFYRQHPALRFMTYSKGEQLISRIGRDIGRIKVAQIAHHGNPYVPEMLGMDEVGGMEGPGLREAPFVNGARAIGGGGFRQGQHRA